MPCEEWIVDTRHKRVVGSYADGVVKDGGGSGNGKKQVGWETGQQWRGDEDDGRSEDDFEFLA